MVCMNAETQMTARPDHMVMNSLHDKAAPCDGPSENNPVTLSSHLYDKSQAAVRHKFPKIHDGARS